MILILLVQMSFHCILLHRIRENKKLQKINNFHKLIVRYRTTTVKHHYNVIINIYYIINPHITCVARPGPRPNPWNEEKYPLCNILLEIYHSEYTN